MNDAAAAPRSQDDTEQQLGSLAGAVLGLRQCKAVGIVGETNGALKCGRQIALQRAIVEPGGVGILDKAGGRADRSWHGEPGRRGSGKTGLAFDGTRQVTQYADRAVVIFARCRYADLG